MKINKPTGSPIVNPYQKQQQLKASQQKAKSGKDQVQISSQAKALLQKNAEELSRQERIDQLKQQIKSGEYQVDSRKVAERIYEFWFEQYDES
jgi:negative regulator of flagellin synthesis FlgM